MKLNVRALQHCDLMLDDRDALRINVQRIECGAQVIDCGIETAGGLEAGRRLAEICMAGLGEVRFVPFPCNGRTSVGVQIRTDQPALACMASQYAGWEVKGDNYFAMGSGPMRAAAAREPLLAELNYRETAETCVGVLETSVLPTNEVCTDIASKCGVAPSQLTLLAAPTRSLAGAVQIVARSVETALHKLHELSFDLGRIVSGWGQAPLPPPAATDLAAIGRTNDAILYGGAAVLYARGDDASLEAIALQLPSSASKDFGRPFAETLARYDNDFYQVDPLLFSPAMATLVNLDTGNVFQSGELNMDILDESFGFTAGSD